MASEGINILIGADDQASKKIQEVSQTIDASVKKIRETGQKAKASTEFIGGLSRALGGTQLAQYAGELGMLSEKVSAFSEVSKLGGAGALAFKAGLVGLVGVLTVKVGSALGNIILRTEKWTRTLADANAEAKKFDQASIAKAGQRFIQQQQDIELIRDPEEKRKAQEQLFASIQREVDSVAQRVKAGKKEVEDWNAAWFKFGNRAAFAEQSKQALESDKQRLDTLKSQRDEMNLALSVRVKENEEIRKQNELETKSGEFVKGLREELELLKASTAERQKITALRDAPTASNEALQLIRERDALVEKQAIEKKAQEENTRLLEQRQSLYEQELQSLEQRKIALMEGEDAAKAYALTIQGLSQEQANQIVAANKQLETQEKIKKNLLDKPSQLQAAESRLLTRGSSSDPISMVERNTAKTVAVVQKIGADVANALRPILQNNRSLQVEIVK